MITSIHEHGAVQPDKAVRIGDVLLQRGIISDEQIKEAMAYQKKSDHSKLLGETLVELQFVTEEQVVEELARTYGIPFARVGPTLSDPKVFEVLPREILEKQLVLPLFLVNNRLTVAVHEPTNVFLIEDIEKTTGYQVLIVAATAKDIRKTQQYYLRDDHAFDIDELVDDEKADSVTVYEISTADSSDLVAGDSPVIKLVNHLIYSAVQEGASDIHVEPDDGELRVRFRIDGSLCEKIKAPHHLTAAVVSRIKIMASMDISERRLPQDGAITVVVSKRPVDLSTCGSPLSRAGSAKRSSCAWSIIAAP